MIALLLRRRSLGKLCFAVVVALHGCASDTPPPGDSAEGQRETVFARSILDKTHGKSVWRVREDIRIGTAHGDVAYQFASIADLEVDMAGRIYVLDRQYGQIKVYGRDGGHIRTMGGVGRGPGEFQTPTALAWGPDSAIWVMDRGRPGIVVLDREGRELSSYPQPAHRGHVRPGQFAVDAGGRVYSALNLSLRGVFPRYGITRFDTSGQEEVDTIRLPEHEVAVWTVEERRSDGGSSMSVVVPYTPTPLWQLDGEANLWFAMSDEYRVVQIGPNGDTLRVVERDVSPQEVSTEERDAAIRGLQSFAERGGRVDPSEIPTKKPLLRLFVVDDEGYVWIQSVTTEKRPISIASEPGVRSVFDVFDPEGRFVAHAAVEVPGQLMKIRGGALYLVTTDEHRVPYVVRSLIDGR